MSPLYRPEINGLRGLAILLVIAYHANLILGNVALLPGGYLGVDIFFVISGYLITLQVLKQLNNNTFSFKGFYMRRARRLLPALFLVIFTSLPLAWRYLLPDEMKEYSGSIISSLLFVSNVWFLEKDSYYIASNQANPFLHTWSLAIEEQFYLLFPPLLYLLIKFYKKRALEVLMLFFLLSLILTQYLSYSNPNLSFYLLLTRSWELLAGCILAVLEVNYGRNNSKKLSAVMTFLGLLLIAGSCSFFDSYTKHPSVLSLIPVTGTVLLLWFCQKNELITQLLKNFFLVKIGLISYSLYLWHYPIFVFAKVRNEEFYHNNKLILISVSFLLSIISFHFIEKKLKRREKVSDQNFVKIILGGGLSLIFINGCFFYLNGVPTRFGPFSKLFTERTYTGCHNQPVGFNSKHSPCAVSAEGERGEIILIGDSHAETLDNQIKNIAQLNNRKFFQNTRDGCLFFNGLIQKHKIIGDLCYKKEYLPKRLHEWLNDNQEKAKSRIIIWVGRLPSVLHGEFDNKEGGLEKFKVPFAPYKTILKNEKSVDDIIVANFEFYAKNSEKLIIVYPIPEVGWNVPRVLIRQWRKGIDIKDISLSTSFEVYKSRTKKSFQLLNKINSKNIQRIYPSDYFCNQETGRCKVFDQTGIFYYDDDHLSSTGSAIIGEHIKNVIN